MNTILPKKKMTEEDIKLESIGQATFSGASFLYIATVSLMSISLSMDSKDLLNQLRQRDLAQVRIIVLTCGIYYDIYQTERLTIKSQVPKSEKL